MMRRTPYCLPTIKMSPRAFWTLVLLTLVVGIKNIYVPLHPDETYYWQWSRHLALSYFDGPPLVAYVMHGFIALFSMSGIVVKLSAILCTSMGVFFVYRLAKVLFDEKTAYAALVILILSPSVQYFYLFSTPDPILFCFWSMTLYCFYMAIQNNSTPYRYLASASLGLTILAKYTGVLLGTELFIYLLVSPNYRKELKNLHWYIGLTLILLILSPILIWNWQHDFAGLAFQYHHGISAVKVFQWELMIAFLGIQLGMANPFFFIANVYFVSNYWKKIVFDDKLLYLAIPFLGTFFFFFYEGLFKRSHTTWPLCAYVSASILLAYFIIQYHKKIWYQSIILFNIGFILLYHILVFSGLMSIHKDVWDKKLIAETNAAYQVGDVVISNRYEIASQCAFYLKNHPQTYILDNSDPRQYQYWRIPVLDKIQSGRIKSALYIGAAQDIKQITPFFNHIKLIKNIQYTGHRIGLKPYEISMYQVWN